MKISAQLSQKAGLVAALFLSCISLCAATSYAETGTASWYGPGFHGKRTANGEVYNKEDMTCAHKTLPFNSLVSVTSLSTGKTCVVRVNDRGPFVKGRVIDLSEAAARAIGMIGSGTAKVKLEVAPDKPKATCVIQVASFSNEANANRAIESLTKSGFKPKIETVEVDQTKLYRVIVRVYLEQLELARTRLSELGYKEVLIRAYVDAK
jgi:rare lipoprotein A